MPESRAVDAEPDRTSNLVAGAAFILASELVLVLMAAMVKSVAGSLPVAMIVFFRNLFGLVAVAPLVARRGAAGFATGRPGLHLFRAMVGVGGMYCIMFAISRLPLADAMMLKLTAPLFIPVVAWLWLGERAGRACLAGLAVGFAGIALILRPTGEAFNWVVLVALAGALFAATAKTTVRRLSSTEPPERIVFYFAAIATALTLIPALSTWQWPDLSGWIMLLAIGPVATLGQLLMTRGFSLAPAAEVGLFSYSSVIFGAWLGWMFWDETWDVSSMAGAALVGLAGYIVLRYRRSGVVVQRM